MLSTVIYPGTFDPITLGHMDIINRVAGIFDKIIVAVAANTRKAPLFSLNERIELAKKVLQENPSVEVVGFNGLLIDFAQQLGVKVILRGLRAISDFEYEFQLAGMNRRLAPEIETLFMSPGEQYTFISATLVREVAELGGNVANFVHPEIEKALKLRFGRSVNGLDHH